MGAEEIRDFVQALLVGWGLDLPHALILVTAVTSLPANEFLEDPREKRKSEVSGYSSINFVHVL